MQFAFRNVFALVSREFWAAASSDVDKSEAFERAKCSGYRFARSTGTGLKHPVGEPHRVLIPVPAQSASDDDHEDPKLGVAQRRHQLVDHDVGRLGPRGCAGFL